MFEVGEGSNDMTQGNGWGTPPGGQNWGQPAQPAPQQMQQPQQPGQPAMAPPQQQPQYAQQPQQGMPMPGAQPPQQPQGQFGAQQPNYAQNPFAGITSGDPAGTRHPFLEAGAYKLKIHAIRFKQSRAGKALYIIEADILESNNPQMPPGLRTSSFIDLSNMDTRGRHLASFTAAVHGYDPETLPKDSPNAPWIDPQTQQPMSWSYYAEVSIHDSNPWGGAEIGCHASVITTKAGEPFTLHNWIPVAKLVIPAAAPVAFPPQQAVFPPQQQALPVGPPQPAQQGAPGGYAPPVGGQPQQPQYAQQPPQQGFQQPPGPPNGGNWGRQ